MDKLRLGLDLISHSKTWQAHTSTRLLRAWLLVASLVTSLHRQCKIYSTGQLSQTPIRQKAKREREEREEIKCVRGWEMTHVGKEDDRHSLKSQVVVGI